MATLGTKYRFTAGKRSVAHYYLEFRDNTRRPKRKRISLGTTDKRVARRKATKLERKEALGLFDPWLHRSDLDGVLLHRALTEFLSSRSAYCSQSTVATYKYVLGSFAREFQPDFPLTAVEPRHIEHFLNGNSNLAQPTRLSYEARLHVFFAWCIEEGLTSNNPVPKPIRGKRSRRADLPEYLTEGQYEQLVSVIKADAILKGIDNGWLLDAIAFLVNTGLRRVELCAHRWMDVDLDGERIVVANTESFGPKSGRKRRVPIKGLALEVVLRLTRNRPSEDESDKVFCGSTGSPLNIPILSPIVRAARGVQRT